MGNRASRKRKARAVLELALLLPLIAFLFVSAVGFARIIYYPQVIENSARQGALKAYDEKAPSQNLYADVTSAALADAPNLSPPPTASPRDSKPTRCSKRSGETILSPPEKRTYCCRVNGPRLVQRMNFS